MYRYRYHHPIRLQAFITRSRILAMILLLLISGCASIYPERQQSLPPSLPIPAPRPATPTRLPPVSIPTTPAPGPAATLYQEGETLLQAGNPAGAEMLLERALRIEPRNPYYWHTLAQSVYQQGKYEQAVQFCLKADSLSGSDQQLAARNRTLLTHARSALGKK